MIGKAPEAKPGLFKIEDIPYHKIIPAQELDRRLNGFQQKMAGLDMGGALILQKADLFYFTGTTQTGWLYIPVQGRPLFMVFKDIDRARKESGLERVIPLLSPKKIPDTLAGSGYKIPGTLGLELDVLPAGQYLMFKKVFSSSRVVDVSDAIRLQRAVKSEFEIRCIQKASALADQVAQTVADNLAPGMREIDVAALAESRARQLGHQGLVPMRLFNNDLFYGHVLCGGGAAVPGALSSPTSGIGLSPFIGQGPGLDLIRPSQPVLLDYVFALNGYLSDHTRIFSLGPLAPELEKAHQAMLDIQAAVSEKARPGAIAGDLYEFMVGMAEEMGYADYFMGGAEPRIRFTAHGLGIELDEFPFIARGRTLELEAGMVIALEPKVVIPGKGVVGIENTQVITETGLKSLTRFPDQICRV